MNDFCSHLSNLGIHTGIPRTKDREASGGASMGIRNFNQEFVVLSILSLFATFLVAPAWSQEGIQLAVLPLETEVQPGGIVDVELMVTEAGAFFNGCDLVLGFDSARLTFIEMSLADQLGSLMAEACTNQPFHIFQVSPDSTHVTANLALLCAGVSIQGPGVIYRLRFQAKPQVGPTDLRLLEGTTFYFAGIIVSPLSTMDSTLIIGTGANVPGASPDLLLQLQAAPNPFNPQTTVTFMLSAPGTARLEVYTPQGQRVRTLLEGYREAGEYNLSWNGKDDSGRSLASGLYLLHLRHQLDKTTSTALRRITLVR